MCKTLDPVVQIYGDDSLTSNTARLTIRELRTTLRVMQTARGVR